MAPPVGAPGKGPDPTASWFDLAGSALFSPRSSHVLWQSGICMSAMLREVAAGLIITLISTAGQGEYRGQARVRSCSNT
ncbi:hypothetical protein HMPREF9621_02620 [Cutibacterium modestum HL037PA2]|nr:hypothetical protein HMPREF9621_02620 [Cutibacterium modestum HL037PA2]